LYRLVSANFPSLVLLYFYFYFLLYWFLKKSWESKKKKWKVKITKKQIDKKKVKNKSQGKKKILTVAKGDHIIQYTIASMILHHQQQRDSKVHLRSNSMISPPFDLFSFTFLVLHVSFKVVINITFCAQKTYLTLHLYLLFFSHQPLSSLISSI
jgi:hypothetical protein